MTRTGRTKARTSAKTEQIREPNQLGGCASQKGTWGSEITMQQTSNSKQKCEPIDAWENTARKELKDVCK